MNEVEGIAGDRNAWKLFMDALCCTRSEMIRWGWWWNHAPCGPKP